MLKMLLALPSSLTFLIVALGVPTCGRPIHLFDVSDSYSSNTGTSHFYELLDTKLGRTLSSYRTPSIPELQRIVKDFSKSCLEQTITLPGSPLERWSSKILDVDGPLSSSFLMSLAPPTNSETLVNHREPTRESNPATEEPYVNQEATDDAQHICCLQEDRGIPAADQGTVDWDRERSMNAVIVILVLFLIVVLLAEAAETIREMIG